jgi:hypothetical protein
MNIILPIRLLCRLAHNVYLDKRMGKPVLVVVFGACICLALVTLIVVHKGDVTAQRGNPAGASNICEVPQAISKEDHKLLDDLFQQRNQEQQNQVSDSKPVPRAELIVNTSQVKRAQLVVNSRVVERAEQVRPRRQ